MKFVNSQNTFTKPVPVYPRSMRDPCSFRISATNLGSAGVAITGPHPVCADRLRSGSMTPERLSILYVSQMPASPPRFGAQARVHGLMTQLAQRHELTAVMLVDDDFDAA